MERVVKKTSTRMADGRELIYYDSRDDTVRDDPDPDVRKNVRWALSQISARRAVGN